jgi:hypothetical protein
VEVVPAPVAPAVESGELERAMHTIESMRNSPFWKARELAVWTFRRVGLRRRV